MKQLKHSRIRTRKLHEKLLKKRQTRLKKSLNTKIHEAKERKKYKELRNSKYGVNYAK